MKKQLKRPQENKNNKNNKYRLHLLGNPSGSFDECNKQQPAGLIGLRRRTNNIKDNQRIGYA